MKIALRVVRRHRRDGRREKFGCGLLAGASDNAHPLALERQARAEQLRQQRKANSCDGLVPAGFGSVLLDRAVGRNQKIRHILEKFIPVAELPKAALDYTRKLYQQQ
jgi:hypothetical protein